jgi:hypothetical protein
MKRIAGLVVGVVLVGGAARAAEAPRAARWIDADSTLIYAELARPGALLDVAAGPRVRELIRAVPGYKRALENPKARQAREVVEFLARSLETTPEEGLRRLLREAVLAVEGASGPERVYLVITPADAAFLERAHAKLVELAREDAAKKGKPDPVKSHEYRGVEGYSADPKEAHAILDGCLVIANGKEPLRALIDRVRDRGGAERSLADDPLWQARRAAIDPEAAGWAMARLDRLRTIDPKRFAPDKTDPGALFLLGPWIDTARRADWLAASGTWTERRLALEMVLPMPADLGKLAAAYLPEKGRGATKPLRPPGMIASASVWRDLSAIWEARGEIFPPEAQQGFAQLDTLAGQFFGGRDFGSGVLGAIGTNWRFVVARQDPRTLEPTPATILPAFALVIDLKEEDPDFGDRLEAAFQSFIGLVNLGAAQTKAPPLKLGSEEFEGVTIATSKFQARRDPASDEPVPLRHNFSPSAARFDGHFVLSSSVGLTRDLIRTLRQPAEPTDAAILIVADGPELAKLAEENREYLVNQIVLEEGKDRETAEGEVAVLRQLLEYLGQATYSADSSDGLLRVKLHHDLGR